MPDCINNFGVLIAPSDATTSHVAVTLETDPSCENRTPVTISLLKVNVMTVAWLITVRLGRLR